MEEHKRLDCCVVRDLLPACLEGLTEPETAEQVRAHLADCPDCRRVEGDMKARLPVETAPRRALKFLRRVRRTRLIAAALSALVALGCMWALYDSEYHYPNTEAGRLAAVEDYVPSPADSRMKGVKEGDPLRVLGWAEREGQLFIAFAADDADNVHGILCLDRGWNGKYQPVNASMDPFPYTAGVMASHVWVKNTDEQVFALMGDGCREIYGAELTFRLRLPGADRVETRRWTCEVTEPDFLLVLSRAELAEKLGLPAGQDFESHGVEVAFLDREGNDVTEQYRDDSVEQSWSGSKSTAERFLLYWFLGLIAAAGVVMVRYFLRRD